MNIFVLDKNPRLAASYHCDKHVVKMILESAQIMSTVLHMKGLPAPYKPTHIHHPCVKWAAEKTANYHWVLDLYIHLCREYTKRYNKQHKCEDYRFTYFDVFDGVDIPDSFVQCMPDEYKKDDPVEAYRAYYNRDNVPFCLTKEYKMNPFPLSKKVIYKLCGLKTHSYFERQKDYVWLFELEIKYA